MTYGACAIDGRYRRMDGRAFGFSGEGKGLRTTCLEAFPTSVHVGDDCIMSGELRA